MTGMASSSSGVPLIYFTYYANKKLLCTGITLDLYNIFLYICVSCELPMCFSVTFLVVNSFLLLVYSSDVVNGESCRKEKELHP